MATTSSASSRASSHDRLLEAAADIVATHGVPALTLEGVAAAAGVTKGGLIYHFKTKDDLLGALVEQLVAQIEQRNRARAARRGDTPGALLQSLLDDTFSMPSSEEALVRQLLPAASTHPHLLGPVQRLFQSVYRDLASAAPNAGLALVLGAALDGMTLLELLGLHTFGKPERRAMRQALENLIKNID